MAGRKKIEYTPIGEWTCFTVGLIKTGFNKVTFMNMVRDGRIKTKPSEESPNRKLYFI